MSQVNPPGPLSRGRRLVAAMVAVALALPAALVAASSPASADSFPDPGLPQTVTTDVLPTVQINGVAWDQVIVGNTVYVAGRFTSARPAGSAAGTNETARSNLLAYDLTTGALRTGWAPTVNAQARTVAASPDGTTIYVGGDFTTANGTARNRIAAFDATTGALRTFNPNANSRVNDIATSGNTVYYVGNFTVVGNQARLRAAASNATTGALLPWAPSADRELRGVVVPTVGNKVVLGGHLETLNGVDTKGMGAVDATTGALLPWPVNQVLVNYGADAAIYSLSTNGTQVFGTGYTYLVNGLNTGNFEGTFGADAATGELQWVNGCRGDTYDAFPVGDVVYDVSHHHDCGAVGGLPQTEPWTYQPASAMTAAAAPDGTTNSSGAFTGRPAAKLLHWLPQLTGGTFTGANQAAWTVEGNGQYVVLGGEFPRVNGVAQNGLVRFALRSIAPGKDGPQGGSQSTPSLVGLAPGVLRVSWTAAWDRDNQRLTYEVRRGATASTAVTVKTFTADTNWWTRPKLSFTDTGVAPGSTQTYRIRVTDPDGNTFTSNPATGTVPAGSATPSPYRGEVVADGPNRYWRLGESAADVAYDQIGADDLTVNTSSVRGANGALLNETTEAATDFPGNVEVPAGTTGTPVPGPNRFAVEAWFRTTTTSGGKIVGFGNSSNGTSNNYDRHVYMANDGRVYFGVFDGNTRVVGGGSPLNDGQWHHVVASLGDDGTKLYVDGRLAGADPSATVAQNYSGFWRVGGDNLGGWPNQPSSNSFQGTIDEVAVYGGPISQDRVRAHYLASGRGPAWPQAPVDAYGAAVWANNPSLFLRLDETSGTDALDRATNTAGATYAGGVVLDQPGSPANPTGRSVTLDGSSARVVANSLTANPQTFSLEAWFKTTSTQGGRILGFGCSQNESSGCYDRHIYLRDDGRLRYGVWIGQTVTIDSPASYNDGQWHHVVVSHQPGSQNMYVDGVLVGSAASPFAEGYTGAWRVGSDNIWDGASTKDLRGQVDEVAVYPVALGQSDVTAHWVAAGGGIPNQAPTAAFTSGTTDLTASFDASTSSDGDGSIVSYSWDFGDGTTGNGATTQRTYGAAGTYTVTLTVTDDDGATDTESAQVTVTDPPPPNQPPTAAFTSGTTDLTASFDASTSSDADGSIVSYSWDFGDGSPAASGATAQRTYAAAGTYTVTLTVTDDDGATDTESAQVTVTPPPNQLPTAAFTSSASFLTASFNGSTSSDPDGSIVSYSWDFGDGSPAASGATAQRTYAVAGTYTVTLTVTDDDGATDTESAQVTVTAPTVFALDGFSRTLASGFGTADLGGAWSVGGASNFSVANGVGRVSVAPATARSAWLGGISRTESDTTVKLSLDRSPTGGGFWASLIGRRVTANDDYRAKVRFGTNGSVGIQLARFVGGAETIVATVATVPGLTLAPGEQLNVRLRVTGTGPTQLAAKVWRVDQPEPATWQVQATDTTAVLQAAGGAGLWAYLSGSATSFPLILSVDDFRVGAPAP